jgi:hypothetical protein
MSEFTKQYDESTIIESIKSNISAVKVRMKAKKDVGFVLMVTNRGLEFYGRENAAGSLERIPLVKSPEQIFDWIKNDIPERGRKPFGKKVGLKDIARRSRG